MPSFVGIETQKAIDNWGVGQTPPELIKAYAEVKKAALVGVQKVSSRFSNILMKVIIEVLDQIIAGEHNNLFLIPLKQGGAGTSLNMNMNEVITYLVNNQSIDEKVDYLEDINRFQSTNDTFNTAVTIVFLRHLEQAEALVVELQEALVEKETSGSSKVIIGRTELQSALPMTISQLFSSYTGAIERDRWRFNKVKERVRCSTLGGTAIGTCFSAPSKYIFAVELELRAITGLSLPRSQNLPSDISMCDKFAEAASVYDVLSGNLFKIASDFMLYTFNGELSHPELQCGSTIMPTKINPVLLEYIKGLSIDASLEARKIGEYARNGQFQLNPLLPFILESEINIHGSVIKALKSTIRFVKNHNWNSDVIESNLLGSDAIINSLRPYCKYAELKILTAKVRTLKPNKLEDLIEVISRETKLDKVFLTEYLKPGGFTSHYKESL